jgi:beta-glucanase (GH16 family)
MDEGGRSRWFWVSDRFFLGWYITYDQYSNGQFEMTTNTDENVFVKDGVLTIKPTLQDQSVLESNNVIDLRGHGCTGSKWTDCVTSTNTTNGTIINPVKSGRINTKLGASIKFGRVEVLAKLPAGDWLWPAIWMLPRDNVYGEWPRSGEIDIMESRGNNYTYKQGGNNIASSTLHFGPDGDNDGWWRNNVKRKALHTTYASDYNVYGVEVRKASPEFRTCANLPAVEREIHLHIHQLTPPASYVHTL